MKQEEQNQKEVIPSIENKEGLSQLSKDFTPKDVKFLLALNVESSIEDCYSAAKGMVERLKKFHDNGYNYKKAGLNPNDFRHQIVK